MTKMKKIILLLILIIVFMFFAVWVKGEEKKPIKIEPIQIESSSTSKNHTSSKVTKEEPMDILSKLKVATKVATEGITPSKEEVSNKVLESLKESVTQQEIEEPKVVKPIRKKIVTKSIIKKRVVKKQMLKKRVVSRKTKVIKKRKPTKNVKIIKKHKAIKSAKVIKEHTNIKHVKIVENPIIRERKNSQLSREEEVALYEQKYSSGLEVVNVTKPFEIKEKKSLPDSHYFKPQAPIETPINNNPTKFVKTLGVVAVSNAYETPLVIPKKLEVAKEGVVEFPDAKVETEDLKKLKFVKPIEVIKVSKPFETIEAHKYLK